MTMVDVAKMAGVSQATVSRVVNGQRVSHQRAQQVRRAMGELGYQPPPPTRRQGRRAAKPARPYTAMVGVVLLDNVYRYTPGVLAAHIRGIEQGAAACGMGIAVTHVSDPDRLSPVILNGHADGYVLMGSEAHEHVLRKLQDKPSIWFGSHHGPSGDTVLAGNYQIGSLAADYLLNRGHRHLAFLSAMDWYPAYPARAEAFAFTVQRADGTALVLTSDDPARSVDGMREPHALRGAMQVLVDQLLAATPRCTGLFVPNDMMTAVVYPMLERAGVMPGRDIDVISCNNEAAYLVGLNPRPATIDIGAETMGRRCVEQLVWRMNNADESRQVQVAVEPVLIEGEMPRR